MNPRGDQSKTKKQLIDELNDLRDKLVKLVSLSELEAIFKVLPDIYFRMDGDGTIMDFKAGEQKDLFAKPADFLGKPIHDVLPPHAAKIVQEAKDKALNEKRLVVTEYTLDLSRGKQDFEARLFPLPEGHLVTIVRNITSRKKMEKESTRLQSFPELSPNPVLETDGNGVLTSMNPAARKRFPDIDSIPDHPILKHLKQLSRDPGNIEKLTIREVNFDDRVYEQHISYIPKIDRIRVYINDITIRKEVDEALYNHRNHLQVLVDERTVELETINQQLQEEIRERVKFEESLKASEANYKLLFSLGSDAKFVYPILNGQPGRFTDVNKNACTSLGFDREELLKLTPSDIARYQDPEEIKRNTKNLFQSGTSVFEAIHISKDGSEFPVEISAQLFYRDNIPMVVSIVRDITRRKIQEQELKKAKEVAESANRLKSQFLANMSHDIRTPLNAILGFADLMLKGDIDEKSRSHLTKINNSGDGLLTLLNDILDFSKIEAGQLDIVPHTLRLDEVISQIHSSFDLQFSRKGLMFLVNVAPEVPGQIYGDKWRIVQVLNNLISNALKYTDSGKVEVNVTYDAAADHVLFRVLDTGTGIPRESLEDIFLPFTQLYNPGLVMKGGTGIGLAICRNLATLMGGNLTADSVLNEGSEFRFDLPVNSHRICDTPVPRPVAQPKPTAGLERKLDNQILVVDDNLVNLELIIEQLKKEGFHFILAAHNGREAINLAINYSPDLILIDIQMPDMSGNEAIRKLRLHGCQTPIIALSAFAMHEYVDETMACGANDYITKPIDFNLLFAHINRFLDIKPARNRPRSPAETVKAMKESPERPPYEISGSVSERIRKIFLKDARKKLTLLNEVLATGTLEQDRQTIKVIAHNYRGNAGFLGLDFLAEISCKMDDAFKNGESDPVLEGYTRKLAAILSKVIETNCVE